MSQLFEQLQARRTALAVAQAALVQSEAALDAATDEMKRRDVAVRQCRAEITEAKHACDTTYGEYQATLARNAARTEEMAAQTRMVEKHQYARRCWDILAKANPALYSVEWTVQHHELTWDEIIAAAHRHAFVQVIRGYTETGNRAASKIPTLAECQAQDQSFIVNNSYWDQNYRYTILQDRVQKFHEYGSGFTIDTTWDQLKQLCM